ncbi:hypothetical protein D3C72_2064320 [compost metagenome]
MQVVGDLATDTFTQAQAITVGAQGRQGQVFMAAGRAREQGLAPLDVIGKTAGGENHSLARMNTDRAARRVDHRAADPALLVKQPFGRRRLPEQHPQIFRRPGQPRDQGDAVDQVHGPAVQGEV